MSLHDYELRPPMDEREAGGNEGAHTSAPLFFVMSVLIQKVRVRAPEQRSWSEYLRRWEMAIRQGSSKCLACS